MRILHLTFPRIIILTLTIVLLITLVLVNLPAREDNVLELPEKVLASWDNEQITLAELERHLQGKSAMLAPGSGINETALLEALIRRRILAQTALEEGLADSEAFKEVLTRFGSDEAYAWMKDADIRHRALAETYLQVEVVEQMEIEENDLQEMFELYRPSMPETTEFGDVREQLINILKRQAVERRVRQAVDDKTVEFSEEWLRQKQMEAERRAESQNLNQCDCPSCRKALAK